jgi:hypothetical protein
MDETFEIAKRIAGIRMLAEIHRTNGKGIEY